MTPRIAWVLLIATLIQAVSADSIQNSIREDSHALNGESPKLTYLPDTSPKYACSRNSRGEEHCYKRDQGYSENAQVAHDNEEDEDDEPVFFEDQQEELFMWDPVEVGHERELNLLGKTYTMKTMAHLPKVFEIEKFLSDEECAHMIATARRVGMHMRDIANRTIDFAYVGERDGQFATYDNNRDGYVDLEEMLRHIETFVDLYINENILLQHMAGLAGGKLDLYMEDGKMSPDEFSSFDTKALLNRLAQLRETHPHHRDRFASHTWLKGDVLNDPVMTGIRERVVALTKLPQYLVDGGEPLQLVHYEPHGHYNAHFDGQDKNAECCHLVAAKKDDVPDKDWKKTGKCRLCRYITLSYYLNHVEEGGETAFPLADDNTITYKKVQSTDRHRYNLSKYCKGNGTESTLAVKPTKGKAVLWYNHYRDSQGWLGELDYNSLHGGCDVIKGEKWLAINWLTAPPSNRKYLRSHYKNGVISDDYIDRGNDNYWTTTA